MSTAAPQDILADNEAMKRRPRHPPSYIFDGCVGDVRHSFGYHLSPDDLPDSDYSLQTRRDRRGAAERPRDASAWDLGFDPGDMITATRRLLTAAKKHDPRMAGVREFCGTLNGRETYPWDLHTNSCEGVGSWDDSHLWHVHISFYRDASAKQVAAVVGVLRGEKATVVQKVKGTGTKVKKKITRPKFPLAEFNYYGLITGPKRSHGGYYPSERPAVALIQRRLQKLGYAPKTAGWADGVYGPPTKAAVEKWQRARKRHVTGIVDADGWKALFS